MKKFKNEEKLINNKEFSNYMVSQFIKSLENYRNEFDKAFDAFCAELGKFTCSINTVRNELNSGDTYNLIKYIEDTIFTEDIFLYNNLLPLSWKVCMDNISATHDALKFHLDFKYNTNIDDYDKNSYSDFVKFIFSNIAYTPTAEEKNIIEDKVKVKELSDIIYNKRFEVLEDNPFSEVEY